MGPPPTHTLDEVRRQVSTAENLFYNDRVADSLALLDQTLAELERLPPGPDRAKTFGDAQLIRGMTLSAQRRRDASDDAFRAVLRVDPRHVMSPDAFSPTFRQRFDKLRAELARARKVRLSVQSQPAGATVYVDGFALGHTPASLDLVPGTYQVLVGRPEAYSFPHLVQLREDTALRVDLAFEQTIPPSRAPCLQQPRDGHETPLGNALKLALLLEVDQLVILRLDRPSAGPSWLSAAVLNAQTAQRTREGGIQLGSGKSGGDDLGELARFVVTGETGERVVAMNPSTGQASVLALPPPAAVTQTRTSSTRTWRTPTGIALTGDRRGGTRPRGGLPAEGERLGVEVQPSLCRVGTRPSPPRSGPWTATAATRTRSRRSPMWAMPSGPSRLARGCGCGSRTERRRARRWSPGPGRSRWPAGSDAAQGT